MSCSHQKIECPVCGEGELEINVWSYPADLINPPDSGFEIESQTCKCSEDEIIERVGTLL